MPKRVAPEHRRFPDPHRAGNHYKSVRHDRVSHSTQSYTCSQRVSNAFYEWELPSYRTSGHTTGVRTAIVGRCLATNNSQHSSCTLRTPKPFRARLALQGRPTLASGRDLRSGFLADNERKTPRVKPSQRLETWIMAQTLPVHPSRQDRPTREAYPRALGAQP